MPELSRRRFLTGTSLGVAGIAASTILPSSSSLAVSGTGRGAGPGTGAAGPDADLSALGSDVIAHIRDASTGEVAILVGGAEIVHHDPALVARLLRVARQAPTEA